MQFTRKGKSKDKTFISAITSKSTVFRTNKQKIKAPILKTYLTNKSIKTVLNRFNPLLMNIKIESKPVIIIIGLKRSRRFVLFCSVIVKKFVKNTKINTLIKNTGRMNIILI